MDMSRHTVLVAFAFLASSAVAQSLAERKTDDKAPQAKPVATFTSHTSEVMALGFSSDGKRIVSVSATDVRLWHSDDGKQIGNHKLAWSAQQYRDPVFAIGPVGLEGSPVALVEYRAVRGEGFFADVVSFSPTGQRLLTFAAHDERQRDSPNAGGFSATVAALAFSPDGKLLAAGGGDGKKSGEVRVWTCPKD